MTDPVNVDLVFAVRKSSQMIPMELIQDADPLVRLKYMGRVVADALDLPERYFDSAWISDNAKKMAEKHGSVKQQISRLKRTFYFININLLLFPSEASDLTYFEHLFQDEDKLYCHLINAYGYHHLKKHEYTDDVYLLYYRLIQESDQSPSEKLASKKLAPEKEKRIPVKPIPKQGTLNREMKNALTGQQQREALKLQLMGMNAEQIADKLTLPESSVSGFLRERDRAIKEQLDKSNRTKQGKSELVLKHYLGFAHLGELVEEVKTQKKCAECGEFIYKLTFKKKTVFACKHCIDSITNEIS